MGFQIICSAGGAQMSRADPVAWHVTGKPESTTLHLMELCALLQMLNGANPEERLRNFACVSLFCS